MTKTVCKMSLLYECDSILLRSENYDIKRLKA